MSRLGAGVDAADFRELEQDLDRLLRFVRRLGAEPCDVCKELIPNEYGRSLHVFQGKRRCFSCVRAFLHRMAEDDGPEWDAFADDKRRRAAVLELAQLALIFPVIRIDAQRAMDATEERAILTAWTAARLTVQREEELKAGMR